MSEVCARATQLAAGEAKVLITGETGVGKDLVARLIHARSARGNRPFVAINCAGIAETLLESELFGHVKGSFTGAYRDKVGKLELAHRGTIFLDEIGEMSLRMQALLLRFLEDGEIQRVGTDAGGAVVDVRVLAATNRDLDKLVAHGQFREDLLYRIKVLHLHIPPLRERVEDVAVLVDHFVGRSGRTVAFTPEAVRALERYWWPGNVRELHNVVEQVLWMAAGEGIEVTELPPVVCRAAVRAEPERRRTVADDLFSELVAGRYQFWEHVHPLFLNRDLTRHDLRELVRRGLATTSGNYRALLTLFGMPSQDYKRFLNFLTTHDCSIDFRHFRPGGDPLEPVARHEEKDSTDVADLPGFRRGNRNGI